MDDEIKGGLLFIHHSSFITSEAEAVRVERTGARTPGGLAHRCTTFCATPPKELAEGAGVEPAGALRLRQFSGLLGVPVPNLPSVAGAPGLEPRMAGLESACLPLTYAPPRCIRRDSNPHALVRATALQAAAEPFRPLMRGTKTFEFQDAS